MRKIIAFLHISLDGYAAIPDNSLDWLTYNEALAADAYALANGASAALYGRITYQIMEAYWPTVPNNPASTEGERQHAAWIEKIHKVVFSRTLDEVTWHNTTLIKDDIAARVNQLKQQGDGYMLIFGSPTLTQSLAALDLIDEYRVNVNPISVGHGTPVFAHEPRLTNLTLIDSRTFDGGVVGLHYAVRRNDS